MKKLAYLFLAVTFLSSAYAQSANDENSGTIPNISAHYAAVPVLYHFENMPVEKVSDQIGRQYIYSSQGTLVKWFFKKGAVVPLHHHINEQITWITKGSVRVDSQGKTFIVKAGDVIVIPPNVPHKFTALEDTIDIDVFSPARQDWIDNTAQYLHSPATSTTQNSN